MVYCDLQQINNVLLKQSKHDRFILQVKYYFEFCTQDHILLRKEW